MSKQSIPLLDRNESKCLNNVVLRKPKSRSKCLEYSLAILDCLVLPCTSCMDAKYWSTRRFYQYDYTVQCYGIFQTIIGILWASTFLVAVKLFEQKERTHTFLIAIYCAFTYTLCNIVVIIMQRTELFGGKMSFFLVYVKLLPLELKI